MARNSSLRWSLPFLMMAGLGLLWRDQQLTKMKSELLEQAELRRSGGPMGKPLREGACRFELPVEAEAFKPRCFDIVSADGAAAHGIVFDYQDKANSPVYIIDGGPGLRGRGYVPYLNHSTRRLRFGERSVIYLQMRGIGASVEGEVVQQAVDDILVAAQGLGHQKFSLAGGSFGSRVAIEVASRAPGRIAALFLESVVAPDQAFLHTYVQGTEAVLDRLLGAWSDRSSELDATQLVERAMEAVSRVPIETRSGPVNTQTLPKLIFSALYYQDLLGSLPSSLMSIVENDIEAVQAWVGAVLHRTPDVDLRFHRYVLCQDVLPVFDPGYFQEAVNAARPVLQPAYRALPRVFEGCPTLKKGRKAPTIEGDFEVLILAPQLDARTPPDNAHHVAPWFAKSRVIELEGRTHTPALGLQYRGTYFDTCAAGLLRNFLGGTPLKELEPCPSELEFR